MADPVPVHDIKILREPTVYLVGRQVVDDAEIDRFLADHGVAWQTDTEVAGEHLVEIAGRVCYMSFAQAAARAAIGVHRPHPGSRPRLGPRTRGVELCSSRALVASLTHELIRHRAGFGYSQLSQRYVDESVAEYVEPDCIADDPELHALWLDAVAHTHQAYVKLTEKLLRVFEDEPDRTLRRKLARQAARSVLPNATETKIFVTANARALRHFIELRGSRHAEPEIRKLAIAVLQDHAEGSPEPVRRLSARPAPRRHVRGHHAPSQSLTRS